jgi:hypothetical protein
MPVWLGKATWIEDEAEASEQGEVNAATAHDAVEEVTKRLRFHPHHVEASRRMSDNEEKEWASALRPGEMRCIPPQPSWR